MRRVLPHPFLALFLLLAWLLLTESAALGTVLLGGVLALGGSWAFASLAPPRARLLNQCTQPETEPPFAGAGGSSSTRRAAHLRVLT